MLISASLLNVRAGSSSASSAYYATDSVFVAWLVPSSHRSIGPSNVVATLVLHLAINLSLSQVLALWTRRLRIAYTPLLPLPTCARLKVMYGVCQKLVEINDECLTLYFLMVKSISLAELEPAPALSQVHEPAGLRPHAQVLPAGLTFSVAALSQVQLRAGCLPQEHVAFWATRDNQTLAQTLACVVEQINCEVLKRETYRRRRMHRPCRSRSKT